LEQSPNDIDELVLWAFNALTIALREQGRYADAMRYAEQAHALAIASGDQSFVSFTQYHIGKLAFLQHDVDRAAACLTESLSRSASAEPNETAIYSAIYLAAVRIAREELQGAAKCLRDAEPHWRAAGAGIGRLWLYAVATLAAASSLQLAAAQLFGACAAIASSLGVPVVWEAWTEDVTTDLREDLGDAEYAAAYRKGLSFSLAEAATMALEALDEIERGVTD
jgi:tetratricopeptide (TPR) repeat protein